MDGHHLLDLRRYLGESLHRLELAQMGPKTDHYNTLPCSERLRLELKLEVKVFHTRGGRTFFANFFWETHEAKSVKEFFFAVCVCVCVCVFTCSRIKKGENRGSKISR